MRRFLLLCSVFALPVAAFALDFTDRSSRYADAPFPKPEAAAISLLTNAGAVSGNPDGTFAPKRAVNRAEFLKIAFMSMPSIAVTGSDAADCFPDVRKGDWFSASVCLAKTRGIVEGYADGKFRPENVVNYAEAIKMVSELYQGGKNPLPWKQRCAKADALQACLVFEDIAYPAQTPWYTPYADWARDEGLLLPISLSYDSPLTRGQVARLVAAFLADHAGELELYRTQEQGQSVSSSAAPAGSSSAGAAGSSRSSSAVSSSGVSSSVQSSSSASPQSSSSVSSLPPSSSSSSSAAGYLPGLPVRSRFLVLGAWSEPIASATFRAALEPVAVRLVQVKLKTKIVSIDRMQVLDRDGAMVGTLFLDPYDQDDLTWKGSFSGTGAYQIPKDAERVLVLRARLKAVGDGGKVEQLVQVDTFTISVVGLSSNNTYNSASQSFVFPRHQTTMGRMTSARNVLPMQGILPVGSHQVIASFTLTGTGVTGSSLRIESMGFQVSKSPSIAVSGWELRTAEGDGRIPCSVSEGVVDCLALPPEIGTLIDGTRTFRLYGDVAVDQGAQYPFLQANLGSPGTVGENGAIRWTDGTGHYNWAELTTPVATGTKWQG